MNLRRPGGHACRFLLALALLCGAQARAQVASIAAQSPAAACRWSRRGTGRGAEGSAESQTTTGLNPDMKLDELVKQDVLVPR